MKLKYKDLKTRNRSFNRTLRRYWNEVRGAFDYEDILVIKAEFYPISLFSLKSLSFWELKKLTEHESIAMWEADRFFEQNCVFDCDTNLLLKHVKGICFNEYGNKTPVLDADFSLDDRYARFYRIVFIKEREVSINPLYFWNEKQGLKCLYINGQKLHSYDELRKEIACWIQKIRTGSESVKHRKKNKCVNKRSRNT